MGARILIVEDDADINEIIAVHLARQGHTCTQAYSGPEGIMRLGDELASASGAASAMDKKRAALPFDLIICDLMLPGATGEELIAAVRERDPELPVIVISARTSTTDPIDLLKLGADDYLTKPFDLDELAARVGVQLRHHLLRGRQASVRDASPSDQGACGNESKKFFQLCDPFASTGRSNIHAQASERGHPHESIRVRTSAYKRQDRPHTGIRIQVSEPPAHWHPRKGVRAVRTWAFVQGSPSHPHVNNRAQASERMSRNETARESSSGGKRARQGQRNSNGAGRNLLSTHPGPRHVPQPLPRQPSQVGDLPRITRKVVVGRLQNERQIPQRRMRHDGTQHMLAAAQLGIAQIPAADDLVTVLVGTAGILGVVDVHGLEAIEPHHAVELGQNAVEVVHDVVPAVGNMTGI